MKVIERIKRYLLSAVTIRIITVCLNFVSNVLINRSLGLALKGQYTVIQNYAIFFQLLLNFGICYAYPKMLSRYGKIIARNTLLTTIWLQTIFLFAVSFVIVFFTPNIDKTLIVFLSIAMICNSQISFISLIDNITRRNLCLLSSTALFVIANAICIHFAPGRLYLIVCLLIAKNIYEILALVIQNKYCVFSIHLISFEQIKIILKIGIPTAFLAILITCNYNIDIFLLKWLKSGDEQIGIYGVAYSLSNMLWIVPDAFKELVYSKTAKEKEYGFIKKSIIGNVLICVLITFIFGVLGKYFLDFFYGSEYVLAYKTTITLFCGVIPMIAFKLIHPIYVNEGKSMVVVSLLGVSILANSLSSYFLIPSFGAFGAAIASVVSYSICGSLFYFKYKMDFDKR